MRAIRCLKAITLLGVALGISIWIGVIVFQNDMHLQRAWSSSIEIESNTTEKLKKAALAIENSTRHSWMFQGTSIMWSMNYCGRCSGFAVEAYEFVIPLAKMTNVGFVNSAPQMSSSQFERCLCPGYSNEERNTLLKTMRESNRMTSTSNQERKAIDFWIEHQPPPKYPTFPRRSSNGAETKIRPKFVIGRSMAEAHNIRKDWVPFTNRVDEIWVPASFLVQAFVDAGVPRHKLVVVPEPIQPIFFTSPAPKPWNRGNEMFRFLAVGKWEPRKGINELLRAFFTEFRADEAVSLTLKTFLYDEPDGQNESKIRARVMEQARRALRLAKDAPLSEHQLPRVEILSQTISLEAMAALFSNAHAFVLPTKAEGWCLPAVQALAVGLPTICTNWSGPADFMDERYSFPLQIDGMEKTIGKHWTSDQLWSTPSIPHLRELMRHVLEGHAEALQRSSLARNEMKHRFSREAIAQVVAGEMSRLAQSKSKSSDTPRKQPQQPSKDEHQGEIQGNGVRAEIAEDMWLDTLRRMQAGAASTT